MSFEAERHFARRNRTSRALPSPLVGDWLLGGLRYRFNADGGYALIAVMGYTITNDAELTLGEEAYARSSGATGLRGTWRRAFSGGEQLDLTFGPYGYYGYRWSDGVAGGGHFTDEGSTIALVETRAWVACLGNTITLTGADGSVETGMFDVVGDTLSVVIGGVTSTYARLPF